MARLLVYCRVYCRQDRHLLHLEEMPMGHEDGAGRLRGAASPSARFPLSLAEASGRGVARRTGRPWSCFRCAISCRLPGR
jgi:hypothetical protein